MRKLVFGFCIAPLVTPLGIWTVFSVLYLLGIGQFGGDSYKAVLGGVLVFSVYGTPIAYLVTLLGAVPAFLLLRRRHLLGLKHSIIAGIILGAIPFLGFFALVLGGSLWRSIYFYGWDEAFQGIKETLTRHGLLLTIWVLLGLYCGIASAVLFWAVAIRGNDALNRTSNHG